MTYELLKWLHVLSATLLVGGGFGSAFHLLLASARRAPDEAAAAAHDVLRFDAILGAPAATFQVLGGLWLLRYVEASWRTDWVAAALLLYALGLLIWIPVIAMEFRMRRLAREAVGAGMGLPASYWPSFFVWLGFGGIGFVVFAAIFWLMVTKRVPVL